MIFVRLFVFSFALFLLSCSNDKSELPVLVTQPVTMITQSSALSGGRILSGGGSGIQEKGICWSLQEGPTINDPHTSEGGGNGDFTSELTGLASNTKYHVRAFATNADRTVYGEDIAFITLTGTSTAQIIADHTIVDRYDDIPQTYIDNVKKMLLVVAGESHSLGYMEGLEELEKVNTAYGVNKTRVPEAYTTTHLRISRTTWGDLNNPTGWINDYGEEDWFTSETAIARTKAGISYYHLQGIPISAFGFGWCYDGGYRDMTAYLGATQQYINFSVANGYPTQVFFTTGPVDGLNARDETGYLKHLAYEAIRNYVKAVPTRILFDYADILCYDNGSNTPNTATWNGNTFPIITTANNLPEGVGHISPAGEIRLAKAMWWMLARIAGWNGN